LREAHFHKRGYATFSARYSDGAGTTSCVEVDDANDKRNHKALLDRLAGLPDLTSHPYELWERTEPHQTRRRIALVFDTQQLCAQAALALYPEFLPTSAKKKR
jgi:hypothetical protein